MKKIISILSIFLAFFSMMLSVHASSDKKEDILFQLNILPQTYENADDGIVTRAEFAYAMSKMVDGKDQKACSTIFSDVDETNMYSGYIANLNSLGLIDGWDGIFSPDSGITSSDAYFVILKYIGYDVLRSKNEDYASFAQKQAKNLGLNKKVLYTNDGYLTKKGLITLLNNALTMLYTDFIDKQEEHNVSILSEKMDIDVYKATVTEVGNNSESATFVIDSNYSKANRNPLNNGEKHVYAISKNINIDEYESVPAIVYVKDTDTVVAIVLQNNVEIFYKSIYSVNADTDKTSSYIPSAITTIATYDEKTKYKTDDNFTVKYNGELVNTPISLAGKFARMVFVNNRIVYLETWDLEYGGIISAVSPKELGYIKGSTNNAKLQFEDCNKILVYINDEVSSLKRLKPDSYFDYYENDDCLVIVASEKIITDELSAFNSEYITIGGGNYQRNENLYVADRDGYFSKSNNVNSLIGRRVDAFFNCCDEITYVRVSNTGEESFYVNDFIGIIYRFDNISEFERGITDKTDVSIYMLDGDCKLHTFTLTDKTKYNGVSKEEVFASKKKTDGSGIYLFEVAQNGKIKSIQKPLPYKLSKEQTYSTKGTKGSFANDSNQAITVGGRAVMFGSEDVVLIYQKDDDFVVSKVKASDLQSKNVSPAITLEFFGYDDRIDIRLITAYGEGLGNIYDYQQGFGIIHHRSEVYDTDKDITKYQFKMVSKSGNSITLSKEAAGKLPETAFVRFNSLVNKGTDSVIVQDGYTVDLTKPTEEWNGSILKYAEIDKINGKAIRLDDGEVYFLNTKHLSVFEYKDNEFNLIDVEDLMENERIYYHISNYDGIEAICAIIVIR